MEKKADLTLQEIMEITGISKNTAYGSVFHGEYRVGNSRRVSREVFNARKEAGLDVIKSRRKGPYNS